MRRALLAAGVVLALAWIAVVTVSVASRPPAGEADPAALTAAFRQALADRDERGVERLLYQPPAGTASACSADADRTRRRAWPCRSANTGAAGTWTPGHP